VFHLHLACMLLILLLLLSVQYTAVHSNEALLLAVKRFIVRAHLPSTRSAVIESWRAATATDMLLGGRNLAPRLLTH
jgi:hypothetical protein